VLHTYLLAEVTFPPLLQPINVGTRFSDPGGMHYMGGRFFSYVDLM